MNCDKCRRRRVGRFADTRVHDHNQAGRHDPTYPIIVLENVGQTFDPCHFQHHFKSMSHPEFDEHTAFPRQSEAMG